ncbi:MAG: hypothetical protein J5785_04255 [Spirochaetales bacterium]|nr:hypothetical protein [Spirochaetales bacterium]
MNNTSSHYYHCASKGFDHCILFANDREFIAGMNRIALCRSRIAEVIVLAFCLMDNHVHFILYGTKEACLRWMRLYQKLTMMWLRHHREGNPVDEPWECDAWQIYDEEDLKQKIVYVFRNPTVARMGFVPGGYRWSSARFVFTDAGSELGAGRRLGTLSSYENRKLFETRIDLPADWTLLPNGLIWPGNYTETGRVEKLFGHPWNYLFCLNQNVESEINRQMYKDKLSLPDQDVAAIARELSDSMFGSRDISSLDLQSRLHLCKLVKKKTGASLKQLARIVRLPLADLKMIFD